MYVKSHSPPLIGIFSSHRPTQFPVLHSFTTRARVKSSTVAIHQQPPSDSTALDNHHESPRQWPSQTPQPSIPSSSPSFWQNVSGGNLQQPPSPSSLRIETTTVISSPFKLRGMTCIGQKGFRKALELLHNVVTSPMTAFNAIAVEAYKKHILVSLIHNWNFCTSLPKYNSSVCQRNLKNYCQPYIELAHCYVSGKIVHLEEMVDRHRKKYESDNNLGQLDW